MWVVTLFLRLPRKQDAWRNSGMAPLMYMLLDEKQAYRYL